MGLVEDVGHLHAGPSLPLLYLLQRFWRSLNRDRKVTDHLLRPRVGYLPSRHPRNRPRGIREHIQVCKKSGALPRTLELGRDGSRSFVLVGAQHKTLYLIERHVHENRFDGRRRGGWSRS